VDPLQESAASIHLDIENHQDKTPLAPLQKIQGLLLSMGTDHLESLPLEELPIEVYEGPLLVYSQDAPHKKTCFRGS